MKTCFLLLALLALAATAASAQQYAEETVGGYEQVDGGAECELQLQQARLGSCKDYVAERCVTMKDFPVSWPSKWWKGGCEGEVRYQCCEQLNQVAQQCRCQAIWRAIQGELGGIFGFWKGDTGKRLQRAKSLLPKCNMGPECSFPLAAGYDW